MKSIHSPVPSLSKMLDIVLQLPVGSSSREIALLFIRSFHPQQTVRHRHVRLSGRNECWRFLCAEAGEGA